MIFIQKQILLLLALLSAQESQFQQAQKPQICFAPRGFAPWTPWGAWAAPRPLALWGASGPQCW